MSLPKIEMTGTLAQDPITREIKTGHMVTGSIKTTRSKKINDKWEVQDTLFMEVVAFSAFSVDDARRLAMAKKGARVTVTGVLTDNTWVKDDGTKVPKFQVKVATVQAH